MTVAIVDYGSGNLRSAAKAFERMAREAGKAQPILVTDDPDIVARADRIVLPGQGAFADCMDGLARIDGMVPAIEAAVVGKGRPFLGICVGMQLMATRGLEHRVVDGFDWIAGEVEVLRPADPALKIPHMGWNELVVEAVHPVLRGLEGRHAYFVHSYQFRVDQPGCLLATADYGGPVTAVAGRDTMIGTQFHPEKSQAVGLALIANFLDWTP